MCISLSLSIYIYICIHTYIYTYTYTSMYTYIHTYIYLHIVVVFRAGGLLRLADEADVDLLREDCPRLVVLVLLSSAPSLPAEIVPTENCLRFSVCPCAPAVCAQSPCQDYPY